jgi:3-oxoacyl-[acyl-carrier-protein] synthase III
MTDVGISYLDYYIPGEELSIGDFLAGINETSLPPNFKDKAAYEKFIASVLELKSVRIETRRAEPEMLGVLLEKMFSRHDIEPADIDLVILAQEPLLSQMRNLAQFIQYSYKMSRAYAMHTSGNLCTNIEVALDTACSLLDSREDLNNILIIGSIKVEKLEDRILGTYGIYGDGAGIMLVSRRDSKIKLLDNEILCDGSFYKVDLFADNTTIHSRNYLTSLNGLIGRNSLEDDMIDKIIVQNANPLLVSQCIALAGLDNDKIFSGNFGKYGHLDCLDFLVNLRDATRDDPDDPEPGEKLVLSVGIGWAGTYVSSLLSY